MKNFFFATLGGLLIIWSFYVVLNKPAPMKYQSDTIVVEGKILKVEIADTEEKRNRGLSGRSSLSQGTGMLFVFEEEKIQRFWMPDMLFRIDIVWLERIDPVRSGFESTSNGVDNEFKIVGIERNVGPESFPNTFSPSRAVKYVVETNPGEL